MHADIFPPKKPLDNIWKLCRCWCWWCCCCIISGGIFSLFIVLGISSSTCMRTRHKMTMNIHMKEDEKMKWEKKKLCRKTTSWYHFMLWIPCIGILFMIIVKMGIVFDKSHTYMNIRTHHHTHPHPHPHTRIIFFSFGRKRENLWAISHIVCIA